VTPCIENPMHSVPAAVPEKATWHRVGSAQAEQNLRETVEDSLLQEEIKQNIADLKYINDLNDEDVLPDDTSQNHLDEQHLATGAQGVGVNSQNEDAGLAAPAPSRAPRSTKNKRKKTKTDTVQCNDEQLLEEAARQAQAEREQVNMWWEAAYPAFRKVISMLKMKCSEGHTIEPLLNLDADSCMECVKCGLACLPEQPSLVCIQCGQSLCCRTSCQHPLWQRFLAHGMATSLFEETSRRYSQWNPD